MNSLRTFTSPLYTPSQLTLKPCKVEQGPQGTWVHSVIHMIIGWVLSVGVVDGFSIVLPRPDQPWSSSLFTDCPLTSMAFLWYSQTKIQLIVHDGFECENDLKSWKICNKKSEIQKVSWICLSMILHFKLLAVNILWKVNWSICVFFYHSTRSLGAFRATSLGLEGS